jgi:ADP-heptose:LPS heptosyltransferase
MKISKKINVFRRNLTQLITKNIGNSQLNHNTDFIDKAKIKRILICRPNQRLGNLLLITPLIQEVTTTFPECKIDLFVKGFLAPIVFKNYENINLVFELPKKPFKTLITYFQVWTKIRKQQYDIVINVDKNSSSGKLATQFARSKYKFYGDSNDDNVLKHKDYEHIAKYPVYNFRSYLTPLGLKINDTPIPSLNLKLSTLEIAEGGKVLNDIVKNDKKTICIFTFATGEKCYSESWWENFYERLKKEYSNYNIIEVLPVENVSQIAFKAPTFYSKDIRQIGSLIANTELFIGADSGIMHLASSVKTTTVGLFSITDINKYQPYDNNSVAINTNISNTDDCIKILNSTIIPG